MYYEAIKDIRTATWLSDHGATGEGYHYLDGRQVISGMYNCTNVPRQPLVRQGSCDNRPIFDTNGLEKTYITSGTTVFYNASVG